MPRTKFLTRFILHRDISAAKAAGYLAAYAKYEADGSIADEPHFVVMGGTIEPIATALKESYAENADLHDALHIAVEALRAGSADTAGNGQSSVGVASLEVAILDANRPRRAFRRINRATLETLLQEPDSPASGDSESNGESSD